MNLSEKGASIGNKKLSAQATLNPNAAEFVPFALQSQATSVSVAKTSSKFAAATAAVPGKSILDRSDSSISTNSEEEARQYWCHQLPDDITPDFKVIGMGDTLSFSNLSLADGNEGSRYASSASSGFMLKEKQGQSLHPLNGNIYAEKLRYPVASYGEYSSPTNFQPSLSKPWEKQIVGNNQLLAREERPFIGNSRQSFLADMSNEQLFLDNADLSPLEFLGSQFPGFTAESLAEVHFANEGDLSLTIEMLTQLELQVDGGLNQTLNPKALPTPNLSSLDFGALPGQNGFLKLSGDDHQSFSPYQPSVKDSSLLFRSFSSVPSRGATDFASAVKNMASQDSGIWKYDRYGFSGTGIGPSRSSQILASSYISGQGKGSLGERLQNRGSPHASLVRLESGEAVANVRSILREEARNQARVRNAYFEQAWKAYVTGKKALAKELSIKGQLHNMQMKAAHEKAQESTYRQRNPDVRVTGRERIIDLRGRQVSEAIHVLKRELAVLRSEARSTDKRLLVYIFVGTGQHARGSCISARLPTAVQYYLLEEEGLEYSEPQPGLLRVLIY